MKRVWALQAIQDAVKAVKTMKELDIEAKVLQALDGVIGCSQLLSITSENRH